LARTAWIAVGVILGTAVAIVVNLVTAGGAWWLWPVLIILVAAAVTVSVLQNGERKAATEVSQETSADHGEVNQSPQIVEGVAGTSVSQIITAWRGKVNRSGQTVRSAGTKT
jgi:hypothetical protein